GHILEQISDKQKDRIRRSAEYYFSEFQPDATDCRFDYLAIEQGDEDMEITHLKQIFDMIG
ncbi:MAG: hypothetical protein OEZ36_08780, partial [Spirochaetota bacterium]|nr:hypothetical protein [Spirochaetota bacterium]